MAVTRYFLGGNTASGVVSFSGQFCRGAEDFLWVIKGGPGCGKSTLMKRLARAAQDKGEPIQRIHCASDPDSLDGVVLLRQKRAIIDATAPHVVEPEAPGADERVLSLYHTIAADALHPHKDEVTALFARNPLLRSRAARYVASAGSLLLEQPDLTEAERRTLLEQIRQETRWLTRITENMLSITRMAGGQVALRLTDEVVEEIVDGAVMKLRRSSASLPVTVERPQEIITAPMDATLMEQVVLNLLENAVNHAAGATRIRVSIARQEKMVQITVLDDGCGFPPELPGSLTEGGALPLARSCADGRRGLGLGLTLCSAIIKAHGGRMTAENRPEGGAQVTLWLPAGNDTEEAPYEAL